MSTLSEYEIQVSSEEDAIFNPYAELKKHAWHSGFTALDAEKALLGHSPYTYLTRPCYEEEGFMISFVGKDGQIQHNHFAIVDRSRAFYRNYFTPHIGPVNKVIHDMMKCEFSESTPLA